MMTKLAKSGIGLLLLFALCTLLSTQIYWQHLIAGVVVISGAVVCITPPVLIVSLLIFARRGTLSREETRLAGVWLALYAGVLVLIFLLLAPHILWKHESSLSVDGKVYQLQTTIFPVNSGDNYELTPIITRREVYACDGTGLFCSRIGEFRSSGSSLSLRLMDGKIQVVDLGGQVAWEFTP